MKEFNKLPSSHEAEELAIYALRFLASDPARLGRFLTLTGLEPDELKANAGEPHMLSAVLEYLLSDESLLLVFAADHRVAPARVTLAHRKLAGLGVSQDTGQD